MPSIDVEIEPYEFIRGCRKSEIKELIEELVDSGYLPPSVRNWQKTDENQKGFHPSEAIFEEALDKIHGNYNRMTSDEEETILKIANRL
jgi:hypothetical protein